MPNHSFTFKDVDLLRDMKISLGEETPEVVAKRARREYLLGIVRRNNATKRILESWAVVGWKNFVAKYIEPC